MGLAAVDMRHLLRFSDRLVRRDGVLTLGRQQCRTTLAEFIAEFVEQPGAARSGEIDLSPHPRLARMLREEEIFMQSGAADPLHPPISADVFFAWMGYEAIESVDVSAYEQVTHVHDLNQPGLLEATGRRYDLVFDGGTMEHVFHTPNFLKNIFDVLAVGGHVHHMVPMNNLIDHGFFQISPTFFVDFYGENGFEIEDVTMVVGRYGFADLRIPYTGDIAPVWALRSTLPMLVSVLARKTEASTGDRPPFQSRYTGKRGWRAQAAGPAGDGT